MKKTIALTFLILFVFSLTLIQSTGSATLIIVLNETVNETGTFNGTADFVEDQGTPNATGIISVQNTFSEQVYDINITFSDPYSKVGAISGCTPSGRVSVGGDSIHITYLDNGEIVNCSYAITLTRGDEPLNFTENYSNYRSLVDANVTVTANVSNNWPSNYTIRDIVCTKIPTQNASHTFELYNISGENSTKSGENLVWYPNITGSLPNSTIYFIETPESSQVSEPQYLTAGNWSCDFTLNNTASGYIVSDVIAGGGEARFGIDKRQDGSTWYINASINNTNAGFAINVTYVARWATVEGSTVPDASLVSGSLNDTPPNLPAILLQDEDYGTGESNFSYSGIPVVWMNTTFFMVTNNSYMTRTYTSQNGTYKYIERIWVINGYKIEIIKTVTNTSLTNVFNITLYVRNTGNVASPDNVYVYDFIPSAFYNGTVAAPSPLWMNVTPYALLKTDLGNQHGSYTGNQSTDYDGGGMGFYWLFSSLNSDAPNNNVTITYLINGTGDYKVGDTYIVGVDPIQTGPGTIGTERLEILQLSSVSTMEPVMVLITIIVLVLFIYKKKKKI